MDMHDRIAAFTGRAQEEGLVDVAYTTMDSPIGTLTLAATPKGLVRIGFGWSDRMVEDLAEELSPRVLEAPAQLDQVRRELDEYFAGTRTAFDLPLDWSLVHSTFRRRVLEHTNRIPYGQTLSYQDVAGLAGNPQATRAAGTALGSNPIPLVVPCHRVLRTGGALGGYGGGLAIKRQLLDLESGHLQLA